MNIIARDYDAAQFVPIFGGVHLTGYPEGTFISIQPSEDTYTEVVGADGLVSRAKTNNKTATATITLQQTSTSNDFLSAIHSAGTVLPFLLKDLNGTTAIFSAAGWIKRVATVEGARDITNREWTLFLTNCETFVGGNVGLNGGI